MSDDIIKGLREQNEPAVHVGKGYWVQGDCVFINADSPQTAINLYRERLAAARIGINHNHFCGSIIALKRRDWINAIRNDPSIHNPLKTALEEDAP